MEKGMRIHISLSIYTYILPVFETQGEYMCNKKCWKDKENTNQSA